MLETERANAVKQLNGCCGIYNMEEYVADNIAKFTTTGTMILSEILNGVTVSKMFQTLFGQMVVTHDVQVNRIQYDSRKVGPNDIFVAIRGQGADGHSFISQAVNNGAKVVVLERDDLFPDSYFMHNGVIKVVVQDSRVALAQISANYYSRPAGELTMVGVTGTNGKTTTAHLVKAILASADGPVGMIGTIEYTIGDDVIPASHTTPESLELQGYLRRMADAKCRAAVMEVSSHALVQHRIDGINFDAAIFTNLTQDHLDYHRTIAEYASAKRLLFDALGTPAVAVINFDDSWGQYMVETTKAARLTYGVQAGADVRATNISLTMRGTAFNIAHGGSVYAIDTPLIGRFNVSNVLAAFTAGIALGVSPEKATEAIHQMNSVRGRFERYASPQGWTAIIDYAHTPDALLKALLAVRDLFGQPKKGKIITVFGCGGNRDRSKRPQMGEIAAAHSDVVVVTSDNPRHEDPLAIINEVAAGIPKGTNVIMEVDRERAIHAALTKAAKNDVVLIAGKGHEDYQVVGDEKIPFSDRKIVERYILSHA